MSKERIKIIDNFYRNAENIYEITPLLRPGLQRILEAGKAVKRFTGNDLPPGVVIDDVYSHTIRTYRLADLLPLEEDVKLPVKRTVLLHDLPEIYSALISGKNRDITAPEKENNPQLERKVAENEKRTARIIFNEDELVLYLHFESADRYLKGELVPKRTVSTVGMISRIIDRVEAHLTLHYQLSEWALSDSYNMSQIVPDISLTFAFREYAMIMKKIGEANLLKETAEVCTRLVTSQLEIVKSLWRQVDGLGREIPDELLKHLY